MNSPKWTKVTSLIEKEKSRQENGLELIASETMVSPAVLEAQGSILTNKYAEGQPRKRYYGGCSLCNASKSWSLKEQKAFNANFANVQAHSGSQANMGTFSPFRAW